jgi:hypothetical protein
MLRMRHPAPQRRLKGGCRQDCLPHHAALAATKRQLQPAAREEIKIV